MRSPSRLLSSALLVAGCTAAPVIDDVDVVEAEGFATAEAPTIPAATDPPQALAPDIAPALVEEPEEPTSLPGELPAVDPGPPRLRLLRHAREGGCDHEVVARGFPAVNADGSQFAFVLHHDSSGADFEGAFTVETRADDEATIASAFVYDGEAIAETTDGDWGKACRKARASIEHRITEINATFARDWRPMARVPVQWPWRVEGMPALPTPDADAHRRPVEALYHAGRFVARVRGVKVLQSTPIPSWRGEEPEMTMDATEPTVVALYHDAASGRAVAELSYESASCMSDPNVYTRALALAPEVVAAADARAEFLIEDPFAADAS